VETHGYRVNNNL